jgi:hypothetical protein
MSNRAKWAHWKKPEPSSKGPMQRLGHSDASLTIGVYTHVVSEDDVRFAERLDGILRPIAPKNEKLESAPGANSSLIN